jgi:hypothetical protein
MGKLRKMLQKWYTNIGIRNYGNYDKEWFQLRLTKEKIFTTTCFFTIFRSPRHLPKAQLNDKIPAPRTTWSDSTSRWCHGDFNQKKYGNWWFQTNIYINGQ